MLGYLESQPKVLGRMIRGRGELTHAFGELYGKVGPDRVYLVGSGTSLNAAYAAAPFMEDVLGVDVFAAAASALPVVRGKRPLVVYISQGGSSTNTLAAMEAWAGYPGIVMTADDDCEMARRCGDTTPLHDKSGSAGGERRTGNDGHNNEAGGDGECSDGCGSESAVQRGVRHGNLRHMLIGCGEETANAKTVGYTSTVMCLYLCALAAAGGRGDVVGRLELAVGQMTDNIGSCKAWYERNRDDFAKIDKYVLVGCRASAWAGREGALKVLETIKAPALAYEFEEYLHGPMYHTDATMGGLFFICGSQDNRARMLEMARCHMLLSPYAYPVMPDPPGEFPRALGIKTTGEKYTEAFEFVLAPQLLGAMVPGQLGIPEGSVVFDAYTARCPIKFNHGK
jgi:glucosamine 6-phosphate synthetase-like amidotransferase/phosphosugar isomerase protein